MSRLIQPLWMALAITVGLIAHASAQSGTATLQGKVTDAQKAAVPGASVTLSNSETGLTRNTLTNESGGYTFVAVPPGAYKLTVELQGFRTAVVQSVALRVDSIATSDVSLEVGSLAESVQVQAETPVLNTADASLGNVISGNQIRSL